MEQFLSLKQQYEQEKRPIVYIDESGFKNQTYHPYAYAPRGQVCHGNHNWQIKNTTNAIGALYQNQLIAVGLYEFSINSDVFYSWVQNVLLPQLPPNSVLVMDNATFHKRQDIQELIVLSGHTILWLPPYCPDLNLIEHTWAWIKHLRQDWLLDCIHSLFFLFYLVVYRILISLSITRCLTISHAWLGESAYTVVLEMLLEPSFLYFTE
ncbi:IS630 family transposase [Wielerella bovis]|nr:IS630 family transposase [Wielerella bovis]